MPIYPTLNWLRLLGGTADDTGFVLARGSDGGIFLGGETNLGSWDGHLNRGRREGFVARYETNGLRTWTQWYATNQDDQVRGLALGLDGSVYVSGGTLNGIDGNVNFSPGASDGFISRISPGGNKQWTLQVGGSSWDLTRSLKSALDGSAIYAIGYTASGTFPPLNPLPTGEGTPDAYILKISPDKTIQWASRLGLGQDDYGMNLAIGPDGFIYATGFSGTSTQASQAFLVKLNPLNGQEVWRKLIGDTLNDYAESICISRDNYLYVLLSTDNPLNGEVNQGNRDVAVQKYDFNGNRLWTVLHGSPAKEEGRNLAAGNDNSIYITGHTSGNLGGQINKGGEDAFISKITPAGVVEWTKLLGTPGNDVGWDVTTTAQGDLIITGLTTGNLEGQLSNGGQDIFLASFNLNGVVPLARAVDAARFNVTRYATGLGFPSSMVDLGDGSLLVAVTAGDPVNRSPFGTTPSQLVRLVDADNNGAEDGRQVLATLPGFVTSVRKAGSLVFALSSGRPGTSPLITILRAGLSPADPLTEIAKLHLTFTADFLNAANPHTSYALAARLSPTIADTIELYFNLGSRDDNQSTNPALQVSFSATGAGSAEGGLMPTDSLQRVLIKDLGQDVSISAPMTMATGLRNAAGLCFDTAGNLYFEDNGFSLDPNNPNPPANQDISFSADELNRINAAELGRVVPNFGFAQSYVRYSDGQIVNPSANIRQPVVSFLPVNGQKSEGATEIATAPEGFPGDFANTIFTNFFGKFGVGTARNDENPVVATDGATGSRFHFINNQVLGNPAGLLAAPNKLFLSDYSSAGIFFGAANGIPADEMGVIYQISPVQDSQFIAAPTINQLDSTSCGFTWATDADVISTLKVWGGSILEQAPRVVRVRPSTTGSSGFEASVRIDDLAPETLYNYRVQLGDQFLVGSFRTRIGGFRDPSDPLELQPGRTCNLPGLRDYDGNLHGGAPDSLKDSIAADYRFQGFFSLRRDGLQQALFTNRSSGRWASAAVDPLTRQIDYADHGKGGITRVVGIYDDPLVKEGEQNTARPGYLLSGEVAPKRFGPFDSQRRFQNDLLIDNLSARLSGDFDRDGIQELYWKVNDGTAYLRSLLHDDGNIRYANYQSRDQMTSYLTSNGHADLIAAVL